MTRADKLLADLTNPDSYGRRVAIADVDWEAAAKAYKALDWQWVDSQGKKRAGCFYGTSVPSAQKLEQSARYTLERTERASFAGGMAVYADGTVAFWRDIDALIARPA